MAHIHLPEAVSYTHLDVYKRQLEGQPISKNSKNLTELRQKIGMVFQSYDLFPHLNVLDNILLAPMKVQKRKKEEVTA